MPFSVRKCCGTVDIDCDLNAALNIRYIYIIELKAAGRTFLLMEVRNSRYYRVTANKKISVNRAVSSHIIVENDLTECAQQTPVQLFNCTLLEL